MRLNRRTQWMLMSALAGAGAARVAEYAISAGWRLGVGSDPPEDPDDVSWGTAIAWTVVAASAVALSELLAKEGAEIAWRRLTGRRVPRQRRRKHVSSARDALRFI